MDMYLEYLKKIAAQMSPATVKALQSIDSVYKEKLERKEDAEQLFDGLPLSDTESHVIDNLRSCAADLLGEEEQLYYIAGIMDCFVMLSKCGLLGV